MSACSTRRRAAHTFNFILGLNGAREVQTIQQWLRIGLSKPPALEPLVPLTDEGTARERCNMRLRLLRLTNRLDGEMISPIIVRRCGRLIPVVDRLQKNQT